MGGGGEISLLAESDSDDGIDSDDEEDEYEQRSSSRLVLSPVLTCKP